MPKRYYNTESAPQILESIAAKWRFRQRMALSLLSANWKEAVGEQIAAHSQPLRISRNGVLTLAVDNAVWMSELNFQKQVILDAIKERLGSDKIKDLRLTVTRLGPQAKARKKPPMDELDELDGWKIEKLTDHARDEGLKEAIRRAYGRVLRIRKTKAGLALELDKPEDET